MKKLEKDQKVTMFVKGAGVVSKEAHQIADIQDGVITLVKSEKKFDLNGKCLDVDNFFGFEFSIE